MVLMRNIGDFDALHDARRNRRLQKNYKWDVCERYLEEEKGIDEDYRAHLLLLLNTADSEMHKTSKRETEDVVDIDEEEDRECECECDPEYEHFFSTIRKSASSYVPEYNISGKKHKGASTLEEESKSVSGRNKSDIKQTNRLTNQKHDLENDLAVEKQKACGLQAQLGKKGSSRSPRRLDNPIKKKHAINLEHEPSNKHDHKNDQLALNLHGYAMESRSSVGISRKNPGPRNNMVTMKQYQHDSSQARSSTKDNGQKYFRRVYTTQNGIKGKNVLPDLAEKSKVERHTFFEEVSRLASVVKGTKTGFGNKYLAQNKLEDDVQACSGIQAFNIKSEHVEAAECSIFYERNGDGNNQEQKSDDEHSLEVEILDSAEFFKANNSSPFVASKKIHENMGEEDDLQHLDNSSMNSDFRKQILEVLGKPFDKREYKYLQEMVGVPHTKYLNENLDEGSEGSCSRKKKSYLDHHPDVKRKLKANRYNQKKRLTILRGYIFWLKNLTRQGSFKPWLDQECLAVEPKLQ